MAFVSVLSQSSLQSNRIIADKVHLEQVDSSQVSSHLGCIQCFAGHLRAKDSMCLIPLNNGREACMSRLGENDSTAKTTIVSQRAVVE